MRRQRYDYAGIIPIVGTGVVLAAALAAGGAALAQL